MSEENIFAIRDRTAEVFKLHNTAVPQPQFGEEPERYRARVLSCAQSLLPVGHVWGGVPIGRQPESAFDSIERALVADRVAEFKRPVGALREVNETCPRTGRVTTRFYGDPACVWDVFAGPVARRAQFVPGVGRGRDSVQARAAEAAANYEMGLAHAALARERAAAGVVDG
jgi:hypothetical protein